MHKFVLFFKFFDFFFDIFGKSISKMENWKCQQYLEKFCHFFIFLRFWKPWCCYRNRHKMTKNDKKMKKKWKNTSFFTIFTKTWELNTNFENNLFKFRLKKIFLISWSSLVNLTKSEKKLKFSEILSFLLFFVQSAKTQDRMHFLCREKLTFFANFSNKKSHVLVCKKWKNLKKRKSIKKMKKNTSFSSKCQKSRRKPRYFWSKS